MCVNMRVLTARFLAATTSGMQKKTPLALKFDTDLLKRLDRFVADQEIAVTRTSVIETAVRQLLDRDGKRK